MAYEIGLTEVGLTDLQDLATPVEYPKSSYLPYAKLVKLADDTTRGLGSPRATWYFPFVTLEERDMLKTFCAGTSAEVYITTKLNDDSFSTFTAVMTWPEEEERRNTNKMELRIEFSALVEVT